MRRTAATIPASRRSPGDVMRRTGATIPTSRRSPGDVTRRTATTVPASSRSQGDVTRRTATAVHANSTAPRTQPQPPSGVASARRVRRQPRHGSSKVSRRTATARDRARHARRLTDLPPQVAMLEHQEAHAHESQQRREQRQVGDIRSTQVTARAHPGFPLAPSRAHAVHPSAGACMPRASGAALNPTEPRGRASPRSVTTGTAPSRRAAEHAGASTPDRTHPRRRPARRGERRRRDGGRLARGRKRRRRDPRSGRSAAARLRAPTPAAGPWLARPRPRSCPPRSGPGTRPRSHPRRSAAR